MHSKKGGPPPASTTGEHLAAMGTARFGRGEYELGVHNRGEADLRSTSWARGRLVPPGWERSGVRFEKLFSAAWSRRDTMSPLGRSGAGRQRHLGEVGDAEELPAVGVVAEGARVLEEV